MKTKLFLIPIFIGLCTVVSAKRYLSGEESYQHFLKQNKSIEDFHRSQKSHSNPYSVHVVTQGGISGTVYESDGVTPVPNSTIVVWDASWSSEMWFYTDGNGDYFAAGLTSGEYYVQANGYVLGEGYLYDEEYYHDKQNKGDADLVFVTEPDTSKGIDFTLTRRGAISGIATEEDGITPIKDAWIDVYTLDEENYGGGSTDAQGEYYIDGIPNGSYHVVASGYIVGQGDLYATEYYNNKFNWSSADQVVVTSPNTTTGINFTLAEAGHQLNITIDPYNTGEVISNPNKGVYENSEVVWLEADPYQEWAFSHWSGDKNGNTNPDSVVMNRDKNVTAHFGHSLETWVVPQGVGSITRNPDEEIYPHNQVVVLKANPPIGYGFKRWDGHIDSEANPEEIVMDDNKEVFAVFDILVELTMLVDPPEGGTTNPKPGTYTYVKGSEVEINAFPETGYRFVKWNCNVADPYDPCTIVYMNGHETVTAIFEKTHVSLTMKVDPKNGGTTDPPTGTYTYEKGDTVEISAFPANGYKFWKWKCYVEDPYNPNTVVYMLDDETVTAKFKPITCTLTMELSPPEGGTTNPAPGKHAYDQGEVVQISAEPAEGYRFVNWTGHVASPNNSTTQVTMSVSNTVKANFEKIQHVLNMEIDPAEGGIVDPGIGEHIYDVGEVVEISAVAVEGYQFIDWTGEVKEPDSSITTVIMDRDQTVRANFKKLEAVLTIHVYPEEGGRTEPIQGEHIYPIGEVVEIAAIPEEGFYFTGWSGDVLSADSSTTKVILDQSKEIQANFAWNMVTLTICVDPDSVGRTEPEAGEYAFEKNTIIDLYAISKIEGYRFLNWTGKVPEPDSAHTTVLMDSSRKIIAHFVLKDEEPPHLVNCYPCPDAKAVPTNTKIQFKLKDEETGINLNTLNVWINELKILENGFDLTQGNTYLFPGSQYCKIVYDPKELFEDESTVHVHITCGDFSTQPNLCDTTYSFTVGTAKINNSSSNIINQTGGVVVDSTSGVEIIIPIDAVDDTIEISIDHIQDPPPLPTGVTGIAVPYHFGPDGLEFNESVVVQIPFTQYDLDSTGVTDPMELLLFYFHSLSGEWTILEIDSVDMSNSTLFVTITEFCYFSLGTEKQSTYVKNSKLLDQAIPSSYELSQNYPNPFNPETTIQWKIPEPCRVLLEVYNAKGQLITTLLNENKSAGTYLSVWRSYDNRGLPVPTGLYLFRMQAGNHIFVRKAAYVK